MLLYAVDEKSQKTYIEDAIISKFYYCPECGEKLTVKKFGKIRRHHFAHKSNNNCFEYKYDEMTQWHKEWQERFPEENREVLVTDEKGKKCIADVLIKNIEIEFQHSSMPYNIFIKRNDFYNKFGYRIIWIFDGEKAFNKGYNGGPFPFLYDCFKYLKAIPNYLDIYIEGEVQPNLLTEEGVFLHHVKEIDEKKGIQFDKKITIDEFMNNINNKTEETLHNIVNNHPNSDYIVVYNPTTKYDILLDKKDMENAKKYKKVYGKIRKPNYNYGFRNLNKVEIYYAYEPIWRFIKEY
jgi:hypothetical protein